MKKSAIIGLIILAIAIIISLVILISGDDTVETAISEYESGDYIDAIVILNRLIPAAGYDQAEKMHYYRCRSLNSLAEELEDDYDDELKDASLENREKPEFTKYKDKIDDKAMEGTGDLEKIEAKGNVIVTQKEKIATGEEAVYFQDSGQIVMTGNATLRDGKNIIKGDKVTVFVNEDRGIVEADQKKRVKAIIYPQEKQEGKKSN